MVTAEPETLQDKIHPINRDKDCQILL